MADGSINIDVLLNGERFFPDVKRIESYLTNLGSDAGDKMDQVFKANTDKVINIATITSDKVKHDFSDTIEQKVNADTSDLDDKVIKAKNESKTLKEPLLTKLKADAEDFNAKVHNSEQKSDKLKHPVTTDFKANFSNFNRGVNGALNKIRDIRESSSRLKGVFAGSALGSFLGNTLSNGFNLAKEAILGTIKAGTDFDRQMQTMNATWTTLTGSASKGKEMVKMTTDMAAAAANSVDMVQDLNTKLYSVTDSASKTGVLTKSILTLQDAFGQTDDAVKNFTTQFSQMQANGKVQAQDMMSFVNVFPKIRTELLETMRQQTGNHQLTMQQLNDLISAGKVSSDTMDKVIESMGKKYQDATKNFGLTIDGMMRTIKGRIPSLLGSLVDPFMKVSNPIFGAVSSWVSDPKTDSVFNQAGKIVSKGVNKLVSAFSFGKSSNFSDTANKMVLDFANKLSDALDWVGKHAGSLKEIASGIGTITKNLTMGYIEAIGDMFHIFTGAKGDGVGAIADGIQKIAEHKQAIKDVGKAIVAMWAINKMVGFILKVQEVIGVLKTLGGVAKDVKGGLGNVFDFLPTGGKTTKINPNATTRVGRFGTAAEESTGLLGGITGKLSSGGVGEKMLAFGKGLGGKLVMGLGAALSAYDLVKGLTSKDKNTKYVSTGKGIGGLIGTGLGIFFAPVTGGASMMLGPLIGDLFGGLAGKATKEFGDGWNSWAKGYKPRGIVAKVGFYTHEATFQLNNFIASVEKKHPVIAPVIRFGDGIIQGMWKAIQIPGRLFASNFGLLGKEGADLFSGHFNKMWPDFVKTSEGFLGSVWDDAKSVWDVITNNRRSSTKPKQKSSSSKKNKTSTDQAIDDVATVKVSKTDIDNVKKMIPVMKNYEDALGNLKSFLKKHDPTTDLNAMNKRLKKSVDGWDSIAKPIKKVGDAFKALNDFAKEMKSDPFAKLNKDLPKLDKTLKNNKIGDNLGKLKKSLTSNNPSKIIDEITKSISKDNDKWASFGKSVKKVSDAMVNLAKAVKELNKNSAFNTLSKQISNLDKTLSKNKIVESLKKLKDGLTKNNPSKQLKAISKEIKEDAKDWDKLAKPISKLAKSFDTLAKSMKTIEKSKALKDLNKDVKNLDSTLKKSNFGTELQKQINIANKAVGNNGFVKIFHDMVRSITSDLRSFKNAFNRDWKSLWNDSYSNMHKELNKIEADLDDSLDHLGNIESKFSNSFQKTWKSLGDALKSTWKSIWNDIADLTNTGMHKTAGYINSGIQGIDYVLGKFGGSPSTINPIRFASGTGLISNGRLTTGVTAMLNDGFDSPETGNVERVMKANGSSYEPSGTNVLQYLEPGDAVLNASENKWYKQMSGLAHFASGTGIFSSPIYKGINGGFEDLIKVAENISKNINKSFHDLFGKEEPIKGDVENGFDGIFRSQIEKSGIPWWGTVWKLIEDAIGAGGSSDLLKAVEKYGKGKPYVWGATGPDSFDCSGLVMYALKHAFNIQYPRVSGAQIRHAEHISKDQLKPGDLIGNDEHIGVYAGKGKYWSAMSPSSNPNIGMSDISYFPGAPMYGRVKGIHGSSDSDYQDVGKNTGLEGFVKNELGSNMFKWIEKNLSPLTDDSDSAGGTFSSSLIGKAAEMSGISITGDFMKNLQKVIQNESGGKNIIQQVHDMNSGGNEARGILQFTPGTFATFARKGHTNIMDPLDQLLAFFNNSDWLHSIGMTNIWGNTKMDWLNSGPRGSRRFANGGWGEDGVTNIFNEVPGEPEVAINPARDSADGLIVETIMARLKNNPNGKLAHSLSRLQKVESQAHQFTGRAVSTVNSIRNGSQTSNESRAGGDITTVVNLDGKIIADATYPINQARQAKQISIETKREGSYH